MKIVDNNQQGTTSYQYVSPLSPMACGVTRSVRMTSAICKSIGGTKAFSIK